MLSLRSVVRTSKCSAAAGLAAAAMFISLTLAASPVPKGERILELTFQVVDAESGNPVAGVRVGVIYPYPDELVRPSFGTTQADGSAHFSHLFLVGEVRSLVPDSASFLGDGHFFRDLLSGGHHLSLYACQSAFTVRAPKGWHYENTRHVCYGDRWLEVAAPGYRRLAIPLTLFIGEIGNLDAPTPPRIKVELHRGDSPADSLDEWAGEYNGMNSVRYAKLRILADGRFAWTAGSGDFKDEDFGYAAECDDEFKFLPEHRVYAFKNDRFSPVTWGARRYIIELTGLKAFCETVREGKVCDCHFGRIGSVYLRIGDEKVKPQGLPELPRKWASFLLQGPIVGKIEMVYADRSAKVSLGRIDGVLDGMVFTAHGIETRPCQQVEVVQVNADCCIVRPCRSDSDAPGSVSPGDRLTVPFEGDGWPRGDHSGH